MELASCNCVNCSKQITKQILERLCPCLPVNSIIGENSIIKPFLIVMFLGSKKIAIWDLQCPGDG